jgi:Icc-related predicted phosphoesterase
MTALTRVFFVADIHGSALCFRKFVNAARVYRARILVVGGDISAKTLTPLFEENGGWSCNVEGIAHHVRTEGERQQLEQKLRDAGTVPLRTTPREWEELRADRRRADAEFERVALAELRRWLEWARARLHGSGTRLLIGLGNDDLDSMEEVIASDGYAELTDREILPVDDRHELLTLPYSNPTPWRTNRELPEEEIWARLASLAGRLEDPARAVFNIHVPPYGTPLDLAPRLAPDLTKVMTPGGEAELVHVGSTAVREAILQLQPMLGLHGHIHESRGFVNLGRTLSINPGSAYTEGSLLGAIIDLEPDRIRAHALTTG